MHETPQDLEELQLLLDQSYETAGADQDLSPARREALRPPCGTCTCAER